MEKLLQQNFGNCAKLPPFVINWVTIMYKNLFIFHTRLCPSLGFGLATLAPGIALIKTHPAGRVVGGIQHIPPHLRFKPEIFCLF